MDKKLYQSIQSCTKCQNVHSEKVLRISEKVNFKADVMIISEAMAASQVRLSWVNFFDVNWNIWNTWKMLEKFLSQLWLSVYPENPNCVYNTEIVHCFPWYDPKKQTKTIRRPSKSEISSCIWMWFINKEIELVSPKVIFLMGKTSYETFYKSFLSLEKTEQLSNKIENLKINWKFDEYNWIPLIPLQHASWANPRYNSMLHDTQYISLIRWLLY